MGQKVHPVGFRLGIVKDWSSIWYADTREYADNLNTDLAVRDYVRKKLAHASVSHIQIQRPAKNARLVIHTARPGIVIGKKGEDIEALRKDVSNMMGVPAHVSVEEIRKPELDALSGGRERRQPARATDHVSPRHEACRDQRDALWVRRASRSRCRDA